MPSRGSADILPMNTAARRSRLLENGLTFLVAGILGGWQATSKEIGAIWISFYASAFGTGLLLLCIWLSSYLVACRAQAQKPTVSGPQMLEQGRDYRKEIDTIRLQIQTQIDQAKGDKDVIRLNCLLDKLTQLNVNANIMDQALQSLQEAILRRDENAQFHEYTRVTIVNQKVQVLRTEADACVGAETNYVGPTRVVVETPAGLQEGVDQPPPPSPPVPIVQRPPIASPYQ